MNPSTQPPAGQPPMPNDIPFKTDVVENIPMQVQAANQPPREKDDVELDLMMQDVGQELKKNVKRPAKHHFFSKQPKQPVIPQPKPAPQPAPVAQQPASQPQAQPTQPQAQNPSQPAPKAPVKPKTKHSVPVFIILITIIITAVLVVVAVATYKQK